MLSEKHLTADLQTVETFWSIEEAQIAKTFLESEGISCQLDGLAVGGTLWHLANATGGIKLQTTSADSLRACELLNRIQQHQDEIDESELSDAALSSHVKPDDSTEVDNAAERVDAAGGEGLLTKDSDQDADYQGILSWMRERKWLGLPVYVFTAFLLSIFVGGVDQSATAAQSNGEKLNPGSGVDPIVERPPLSLEDIQDGVRNNWHLLVTVATIILLIIFALQAPV